MLEAADSTGPEYYHTQKAPLCLLVYALAVLFRGSVPGRGDFCEE
jgi:hypothetical protein